MKHFIKENKGLAIYSFLIVFATYGTKTQQDILQLSRDVDSGQAVYMQLLNRQHIA